MVPRLNWLDRAIGIVSPHAAVRRGMARATLDATRGYEGAALGRRTEGWRTPASSADAEIASSLARLRNRSRALSRDNPHARKAKSVWISNIIGTGIMPRSHTGNEQYDADVNGLFAEWAAVADADGQLNFAGLQELMVGGMVEGGETLVRRRFRRVEDGLPVPLQLQVWEGDLLDLAKIGLTEGGRRAINGIEFDQLGRRVAYWIFPDHPGNAGLLTNGAGLQSRPIDAGEIVHLYRKERTQIRGVPWCHAVINRSRDLDDYEDAEIMRKKIEACVVAIVTGSGEGDEGIAPLSVRDAAGNPVEMFEPGLIAYSQGGKDVKFSNPSQAGGYPEFKKIGLHSIAAGYLVPYELLTGDLSEVNFSSARVGLVEFRRLVEAVQWLCFIPMALQPIWDWFIAAAILSGALRRPADGGLKVPCEWDTPVFESVNPLDDAQADRTNIRSGTQTLIETIARRGRDPEEVMREHALGNKLMDQYGLVFDSDPRRVSGAGIEQPGAPSQQSTERPRLQAVK